MAQYKIRFARMFFLFAAIAAAGALSSIAQAADLAKPILVTNVRVFDGKSLKLTDGENILIVGDSISKISKDPIEAVPTNNYTVINGKGRVLIPGLIDAHWHSFGSGGNVEINRANGEIGNFDIGYLHLVAGVEATRTIFRGFTTVRDAGGPSFGLKQIIDEGLLVGPRIYPSGASISQTGGHGDRRSKSDVSLHTGGPIPGERIIGTIYLADGPNEVLTAVREQLRRGASQVKLITSGGISSELDSLESVQFTSEEIRAAVQAASDAGTYVMVHNYSSRGARRAIDAGVKCIEHGQLIDEPTMKLIAEKGIWVSMQPFTPAPSIMGNSQLAEASPQQVKLKLVQDRIERAYLLAKKYDVKLAFGTDRGGGSFENSSYQNNDLVTLTKWFTAAEVLRMATGTNGELLALSGPKNPYPKKLGVIEEGAYADLLLVAGNPLDDISILTHPDVNLTVIIKNGVILRNIDHQ